jgi:uncharacterized protein YacL
MPFSIKKQGEHFLPSAETIIDGRILMVLRTGFLAGAMVIPQFLIDHIKSRASAENADISLRRGGMVIDTLLGNEGYHVLVEKANPPKLEGINRKLVRLAVMRNYKLITIDNELEPFSKISGVTVLKLRELGAALKQVFFKGDIISVKAVKRGRYSGEGIGYLDDNSTVVIEGASTALGKVIKCEVVSVLDLPTGRVLFTKMVQ